MIQGITAANTAKTIYRPSFKMAELNEIGRLSENKFGYEENVFIDSNMYKKTGLLKTPAIKEKLEQDSFSDICLQYGCTNNPKANAEFIKNQILSKKAARIVSTVDEEELKTGIRALYMANYDNPDLSSKHTQALLNKAKDAFSPEEYIQQVGVMNAGTNN